MPSDNRRLLPLWEQHWWTTLWMVRTMVRILSWRTSIHNLRVQFISSNPAFCRFHGDAITAKNCTACSCDQCGSTVCDNRAGNCECKPNVEGSNCDRCMVRFVLVVLRTHTKIVFLGGSLGIFSLFWMSSMSLRRRLIFHSMWWRNWPMLMPTRSRRLALWALWTRFLELWRVWMSEWVEISVVSEFLFFFGKDFSFIRSFRMRLWSRFIHGYRMRRTHRSMSLSGRRYWRQMWPMSAVLFTDPNVWMST